METLKLDQDQMRPRIARFAEMKPAADVAGRMGRLPEDLRSAIMSQTVMGLTSPTGEGERNFWDSAAVPAGTPNFGAVYVRCRKGEGASWHVHRYSYENFIAMQGTWRIFWNAPEDEQHVDLAPFDMASIPPGAIRRFEYVGEGEGVLLAFAYAHEHSLIDSPRRSGASRRASSGCPLTRGTRLRPPTPRPGKRRSRRWTQPAIP